MMPILYEVGEARFENLGIGTLPDAISCTVTEELNNGYYELSMNYPVNGVRFDELQVGRIIMAANNDQDQTQPFDIYEIRRSLYGTVIVAARHISYRLNYIPVAPFYGLTASQVMQGLITNSVVANPFTFTTDRSGNWIYSVKEPEPIRTVLLKSNGLRAKYGRDIEWDRYRVRIVQRGEDNGVVIAYGKNLTTFEQEKNIASLLTGIYPYYQKDNTFVALPEKTLLVTTDYGHPRIKAVNFAGSFSEKPTEEQLREAGQSYIDANKLTEPDVSITASFMPLWQTDQYKDIAPLEHVRMGDTVTVFFPNLGVNVKARVTKTVYNVLLDRYDSVGLGSKKTTIDSVVGILWRSVEQ